MQTQVYEDDVYLPGEEHKDDKKLIVAFYLRPIKNEAKSTEQGRPIFDEIEYVKIIVPGQRDTVDTEVTETYRQRFVERYRAWKAKTAAPDSGTPLTEVPWLSVGQIAEFNALNVTSLEQLANLPDAVANKFMGFYEVKEKARRFVEAAASDAPMQKLESDNKELRNQVETQGRQIAEMKAALDKLSKTAKA